MVGMEIAMIDERHFRAAVEQTMLPAIAHCRHSGTMQPATEDHLGHPLPPLAELGHLNYVCYDVGEFQQLHARRVRAEPRRRRHLARVLRNSPRNTPKWHGISCSPDSPCASSSTAGTAIRSVMCATTRWCTSMTGGGTRPTSPSSREKWGAGTRRATRLTLFAHSMGGGIAAAMLERYPNIVDRAVLSSPMIEANMGLPTWLAATVCGALADAGKGKRMAPGQHGFTTAINWKEEQVGRARRASHGSNHCADADTHYQTTAPANEWVWQAARLPAVLRQDMRERDHSPSSCSRRAPTIGCATARRTSSPNMCGATVATWWFIRVPGSVHEIFAMPNDVMAPYLACAALPADRRSGDGVAVRRGAWGRSLARYYGRGRHATTW